MYDISIWCKSVAGTACAQAPYCVHASARLHRAVERHATRSSHEHFSHCCPANLRLPTSSFMYTSQNHPTGTSASITLHPMPFAATYSTRMHCITPPLRPPCLGHHPTSSYSYRLSSNMQYLDYMCVHQSFTPLRPPYPGPPNQPAPPRT